MKGGTPKVYTKKQNKKTNKYLYKIIKIKKNKKTSLKTKLSTTKTIYEGQQWEISHF